MSLADRLPTDLASLLGLDALLGIGARDRVFDAFVLCGPVLVVLVALVGRNAVTVALAALYIGSFVAYVAYKGTRDGAPRFLP